MRYLPPMFRWTTRDCFSLITIAGLALGWWLDHYASRSDEVNVGGHISVDGQSLPSGRIFFLRPNGQFHGAPVTAGQFAILRLPQDEYRVIIDSPLVPAYYAQEAGLTCVSEKTKRIDFGLHGHASLQRILGYNAAK